MNTNILLTIQGIAIILLAYSQFKANKFVYKHSHDRSTSYPPYLPKS